MIPAAALRRLLYIASIPDVTDGAGRVHTLRHVNAYLLHAPE